MGGETVATPDEDRPGGAVIVLWLGKEPDDILPDCVVVVHVDVGEGEVA